MQDLHLHLSGAASKRVLWEMIKASGYKTGIKNYHDFSKFLSLNDKSGLDEYLGVLHWVDRAQSTPAAIYASVYDAYVSSAISGCDYLELRMNITKRSQDGAIDLDSIIVSARSAMENAKINWDINGKLILCMGRDCSETANEAVANKAFQYHHKGVTAIDIAGHYRWPWDSLDLYEDVYKRANEVGLTTTVHCGEKDHPSVEEEMEWVLTKLKPNRLGHGIRIVEYPHLLSLAAKANILFEICISSNLATRAVKGVTEFYAIFKKFEEYGIKYSISTDATSLLDTNIKKENELYQAIMSQTIGT